MAYLGMKIEGGFLVVEFEAEISLRQGNTRLKADARISLAELKAAMERPAPVTPDKGA